MSAKVSLMPPCSTLNICCCCSRVRLRVTSSIQSASLSVTCFACALSASTQASLSPASTLCSVYHGTHAPPLKLKPPSTSTLPSLKPRSVCSSSGGKAPI